MRKPIQKPFERDELIKELSKEFKRLGSLQLLIYDKNRRNHLPSSHIVRRKLGNISWNDVLVICGFESQYNEWDKQKIISTALSKGRQLKFHELLELGLTRGTVAQYFKSFKGLYDELNWDYEEKVFYTSVTNEELLKEYDSLCKDLGKVATGKEINELGKFPFEVYRTRFGTINKVRKLTGYKYNKDPRSITKEICFKEMMNIYSKHGRVSYGELEKRLPFHTRTLLRKFGTTSIHDVWKEVIKEFERRSEND